MFSQKVVDTLTEAHGAADVLLTTSCTSALEAAVVPLDSCQIERVVETLVGALEA
jgi:hypothetical protein